MSAAVVTLSVAIATFILQEGITNIIHGLIFRLSSKIHDGDRVEIYIDGNIYTGTISKRNIRQIVLNDVQTNAEVIIPNCIIDRCVIKNSYNGKDQHNRYVVELPITYEDAENPQRSTLIKNEILYVINECELTTGQTPNININYKDSCVTYSFMVITDTIEDNFKACSYIREALLQNLAKQGIHIAYNVLDVNLKY